MAFDFQTGPPHAGSNGNAIPPDRNSTVNKRNESPGAANADQQRMNARADLKITAKIRRSSMADESLSTSARHLNINRQDGTVIPN